jgi:hypothetical protein
MGDFTVFISSTSRDLQSYRERVIHFLRKLGLDCIAMEEFTPSERSALQICYDKLRNAHIFVGTYAFRYGYVPDFSVTLHACVLRAETAAVMGAIAIVFGPFVVALAVVAPIAALVTAVGVATATASTTSIQFWFRGDRLVPAIEARP